MGSGSLLMRTLYVIRHAQPAVGGVLLGQSDPSLSDVGLAQADALAAVLPVHRCVYSSPLKRAVETAIRFRSDPIILPELAEISYGEWDGLPWMEIENKWPSIAARKLEEWQRVESPGGEPWQDFESRVLVALQRIRGGPLPAIVVAHEAVNAVLLQALTGSRAAAFTQKHCEIVCVELPG